MSDPAKLGANPEAAFHAPEPFDEREFSYDGLLPKRAYTKAELLEYLEKTRSKASERFSELEEVSSPSVRNGIGAMELMLYNMRHIQHHAAQLNLILRQRTGDSPKWVSKGMKDEG